MEKQITVACRKSDPNVFTIRKYSNDEPWNVEGGTAPSGVHATRYLRRTSPDLEKLNPLARFLFENCPRYVFGNYPTFKLSDRVQCFNGKSEADMLREDAERGICKSAPWVKSVDEAKKMAEGFIHCYDLESSPCKINDWHFDIIEPDETDEEYWDREANRTLLAGTVTVVLNDKSFDASGLTVPDHREVNRAPFKKNKYPAPKTQEELQKRLNEIDNWLGMKLTKWSDRPDNQNLCRGQAATWKFRARMEFEGRC